MDDLETSLANPVYRYRVNTSGSILDIFIKPIDSTVFGHMEYSIYGPVPLIAVLYFRKEFFNSAFWKMAS